MTVACSCLSSRKSPLGARREQRDVTVIMPIVPSPRLSKWRPGLSSLLRPKHVRTGLSGSPRSTKTWCGMSWHGYQECRPSPYLCRRDASSESEEGARCLLLTCRLPRASPQADPFVLLSGWLWPGSIPSIVQSTRSGYLTYDGNVYGFSYIRNALQVKDLQPLLGFPELRRKLPLHRTVPPVRPACHGPAAT